MRIAIDGFIKESVVDGPGLREVIFVQGCPHKCPGCHNRSTWDKNGGEEWDRDSVIKYLYCTLTDLHQGVTISGGEPFEQPEDCAYVAREVKKLGKDVVVYTGYTMNELIRNPKFGTLLEQADYIVDGKFEQDKKDISLQWRGSSNQRIWRKHGAVWELTSGE